MIRRQDLVLSFLSGKAIITQAESLATGTITTHIVVISNHRVLLDADLAELYGVPTEVLVQAVKRNLDRFPTDFMFQLDADEWESLRSQSVTSNTGRGGRRYAPYAFTEQGVAMLSSVLGRVDCGQYRNHARLRAPAQGTGAVWMS